MRFADLKIGVRLALAFVALAGVVLFVSAAAIHSLNASDERFTSFVDGANARLITSFELRSAVDARAIAARNMVLVTTPEELEKERVAVVEASDKVVKRLARFREQGKAPGVSPDAKALIEKIAQMEDQYGPVSEHIVQLALAGKKADATRELDEKCRPLLAQLAQSFRDYQQFTYAVIERKREESHTEFASARTVLIAAGALSVLVAGLLGWLATVSITRPIQRAVGVARTVASGDLTSRIEVDRKDETGQLLEALALMNGNLTQLVNQVRTSSENIAAGSGEIATGNQDLSSRTEHQASNLQETSAAMSQLTAAVASNAQNAEEARALASQASGVAQAGGAAVQQVVTTMRDIAQASSQIGDIIGTIDGIAFQTNILALNAAVEAARAGEQGRGFAVVASEVRALAQRSADAAKQVKALVGASVAKVQAGTGTVDDAGRTIGEVVSQVERVSQLISRMSAATQEQSSGISQVGVAVRNLDEMTQQNAALVEQSAAAASSLNQQAADLVRAVGQFKTSLA